MNTTGTGRRSLCQKMSSCSQSFRSHTENPFKNNLKTYIFNALEKKRFWSYFKINFLQKETRLESVLLILITLVQVALAGGG